MHHPTPAVGSVAPSVIKYQRREEESGRGPEASACGHVGLFPTSSTEPLAQTRGGQGVGRLCLDAARGLEWQKGEEARLPSKTAGRKVPGPGEAPFLEFVPGPSRLSVCQGHVYVHTQAQPCPDLQALLVGEGCPPTHRAWVLSRGRGRKAPSSSRVGVNSPLGARGS